MRLNIEPGKYVVAVSGGVDSMVLLHILRQQPGLQLTVAHFDHGIREDSREDRKLVEAVAHEYDLPFVYAKGHLGAKASEAAARTARYEFLHTVLKKAGAQGIITAHHQDDALETAVLNILRGTGRKGLSSLKSTRRIIRPLLHVPKSELLAYAKAHGLKWHEDSTNADTVYLRNYLRHHILTKLDADTRRQLEGIVQRAHRTNESLDEALGNYLRLHPAKDTLDRHMFIMLPHREAREVMAEWLRQNGVREFDRRTIERLVHAAKTYEAGKKADIDRKRKLIVHRQQLEIAIV